MKIKSMMVAFALMSVGQVAFAGRSAADAIMARQPQWQVGSRTAQVEQQRPSPYDRAPVRDSASVSYDEPLYGEDRSDENLHETHEALARIQAQVEWERATEAAPRRGINNHTAAPRVIALPEPEECDSSCSCTTEEGWTQSPCLAQRGRSLGSSTDRSSDSYRSPVRGYLR